MGIDLPDKDLTERGFSEREIKKFLGFARVAGPYLGKRREVVELCSGNGLGAFTFQFNDLAGRSLMIDRNIPRRFTRVSELFDRSAFAYEYRVADILEADTKLAFAGLDDFSIIAIHACGPLTDRVIEWGLELRVPFAVMPCCHRSINSKGHVRYKLRNPPDPRLLLYDEPSDYFDLVRLKYIEECGFSACWAEVSESTTRRNHVLIGVPD